MYSYADIFRGTPVVSVSPTKCHQTWPIRVYDVRTYVHNMYVCVMPTVVVTFITRDSHTPFESRIICYRIIIIIKKKKNTYGVTRLLIISEANVNKKKKNGSGPRRAAVLPPPHHSSSAVL